MKPGRSYLYQHDTVPPHLLASVERIDQLLFDATTLELKEVRRLIVTASQQPFGLTRAVVVENADQLSEAAQNTLLKLLEEPPSFLTVVLATPRPEALLPTVRSRLHLLSSDSSLPVPVDQGVVPTGSELETAVVAAKDRLALARILSSIRLSAREALLTKPSTELVAVVDLLDHSVRRLGQNINQKLVIDALLLNWPIQSSRSEVNNQR